MSGLEKINDMNYLVSDDGENTTIFLTDALTDGSCVFATIREAKEEAITLLQDEILGLRMAIKKIRSLKRSELEID